MDRNASPSSIEKRLKYLTLVLLLTGCASTSEPPTTVAAAPPPPPPPPTAIPFDDAVRKAAQDVLANARLPADQKFAVVIDPLVDGNTGIQTVATANMQKMVEQIIKSQFQQIEVKPFGSSTVATLPLIMVGTFTPISLQGKAEGERDAYRICFALADMKTGKIVSKGLARSLPEGFDPTPLPLFRDFPVWTKDTAVDGYIKTCQGTKAGDPINPAYVDAIVSAAAINEAAAAYNAKRYKDALALYQSALRNPAGRQSRVHAGLYLTQLKLGRKPLAMKAFTSLAGQGLSNDLLAIRFDFKPGATAFAGDARTYMPWLKEIARQSVAIGSCLEVAGHTRRSASPQLDERLSLQRAEFVRQKMIEASPDFASRSSAIGYGSQKQLVGTGKNNDSDALDQRVEFRKTSC